MGAQLKTVLLNKRDIPLKDPTLWVAQKRSHPVYLTSDDMSRAAGIREKNYKYKFWWRTCQSEGGGVYLAAKREAKKAVSKKQYPWTLLFADDVVLASETRDDLQKQVQSLKDRLQQNGLRLNVSKTEYTEVGPKIDGLICVDGSELKMDCFKYLGSKVTSIGDIEQKGRARVNVAWKREMATGVLCDKKVPV
ncbi:hypothetical protein RB195_006458 [Necator americanus]|uniref:Reverse transcriptase domain-containing protein n=1 Tax=Necator americanus TaxID=51031 RepID=A0ABR1BVN6_NECAM